LTSPDYKPGVDVTARQSHARQHTRGRSTATYPCKRGIVTTSRETHFLSAVQPHTGAVSLY